MTHLNPYQSPTLPAEAPQQRGRSPSVFLGWCFLLLSTGGALAYTYIDESLLNTRMGGWPVLIGTSALSIVSAFVSRDWVLAPLCCLVAAVASDVLAAALISIAYAQFHAFIPLAMAFSVPALIIALVLRRRRLSDEKLPTN
jgi:hypothetical protein